MPRPDSEVAITDELVDARWQTRLRNASVKHGDLVTALGHPPYHLRSDESGSADHQHSHADSSFPNTPENIIRRLAVVRCERTSRGSSKCFGLYLDFDHFESASKAIPTK